MENTLAELFKYRAKERPFLPKKKKKIHAHIIITRKATFWGSRNAKI